MEQIESLGAALPREMARVRDKVLPEYVKIPTGALAAHMMKASLDLAAHALAQGDVVKMIIAYKELKNYSL